MKEQEETLNRPFSQPPIEKAEKTRANRSLKVSVAHIVATCGVGYLPVAPGTWGSLLGILIYLGVLVSETNLGVALLHAGWESGTILAAMFAGNLVLLGVLTFAGIWSAGVAARLFGTEDPHPVVIDEVLGQLIVFLFIPLTNIWWMILAGFLLFRLFDIWKPYPVDSLQDLPGGLGICADDILAGVYAGVCLSVIYAVSLGY